MNKIVESPVKAQGKFYVSCETPGGRIKWRFESPNLVVNIGLQYMNNMFFAGENFTPSWFIGIYGSQDENKPNARDTAQSHAGWKEITSYLSSRRPQAFFGQATNTSPSVISNEDSPVRYTMSQRTKVGGAFLIDNDVKGGDSGLLFCATDFPPPGDRELEQNDILNIIYEFGLGSA